jgi:mannose-1-phosphate guanylyltransferase
MLQHTLDRADAITISDQKVTIVANDQHAEATRQAHGRRGFIVAQPADRGTAAGVFLPLVYVRHHAPRATVVVYPSDHFVAPEAPFIATVTSAMAAADRLADRIVLVGVRPDRPESDYGWVTTGGAITSVGGVRAVTRFVEKPAPADAEAARRSGALWNTFVFAARADLLWELGRQYVPSVIEALEPVGRAIGTTREAAAIGEAYRAMPALNFSTGLLEQAVDRVAAVELTNTHWSDWGRPERIASSLACAQPGRPSVQGGLSVSTCS